MVHIIKVYYEIPGGGQEIRRLTISSDTASHYRFLQTTMQTLFPELVNEQFAIKWKDSEDDMITISSDGELAQALANCSDDLLRLYVSIVKNRNAHANSDKKEGTEKNKDIEEHFGVLCDGCNENIFGHRYKCLQCTNFDLCSHCNNAGKHSEHDMIKLVRAMHWPREWIYPGSRKLFCHMFKPDKVFRHFHSRDARTSRKSSSSDESSDKKESPTEKADATNRPKGKPNAFGDTVVDFFKGEAYVLGKFMEDMGMFLNPPNRTTPTTEKAPAGNSTESATNDKSDNKEAGNKATEKTANRPSENDVPSSCVAKKNEESAATEKAETPETAKPVASEEAAKNEKKEDCEKNMPGIHHVLGEVVGLFKNLQSVDMDVELCGGEWTLVPKEEDNSLKPEAPIATASSSATIQPEISVEASVSNAVGATAAQPEPIVTYPELPELNTEMRAQEIQETAVKTPEDPHIAAALIAMQNMGFTNEGEWLTKLLVKKNGNIEDALAAVYPE